MDGGNKAEPESGLHSQLRGESSLLLNLSKQNKKIITLKIKKKSSEIVTHFSLYIQEWCEVTEDNQTQLPTEVEPRWGTRWDKNGGAGHRDGCGGHRVADQRQNDLW